MRKVIALMIALAGCGDPDFCEEGQESYAVLDQDELGNKSWDGDSFWITGYDQKIRLLGIDSPNISGSKNLYDCTNSSTEHCQNWEGQLGSPLDMKRIASCYQKGLDHIEQKLRETSVCVIKDDSHSSTQYGSLLRYLELNENGMPMDFAAWQIVNGYSLTLPSGGQGSCDRCDEYREIAESKTGCLWEE